MAPHIQHTPHQRLNTTMRPQTARLVYPTEGDMCHRPSPPNSTSPSTAYSSASPLTSTFGSSLASLGSTSSTSSNTGSILMIGCNMPQKRPLPRSAPRVTTERSPSYSCPTTPRRVVEFLRSTAERSLRPAPPRKAPSSHPVSGSGVSPGGMTGGSGARWSEAQLYGPRQLSALRIRDPHPRHAFVWNA
eukprot:Sspe_Gene.19456::Locus_7098_Transcript_2_2_Confidence_0.500_Length_1142::g.19456::m.19456